MQNINYETETILPATSFYDRYRGLLIINPESLIRYTEIICTDENCRFPQLALRILNHVFSEIDKENKFTVNARRISKQFGVHYDTVTKCLKYLRSIGLIKQVERTYH